MYNIIQNDTYPPFEAVLYSAGGKIDLTGATVTFIMANRQRERKINAPATIVDAKEGRVKYDWALGDTDTPGDYFGSFIIHYPNGKRQTVPNDWYNNIKILEEL